MSGRLVEAWEYAWNEIWRPLWEHDDSPADLFMLLYPALAPALVGPVDPQTENDATNNSDVAAQQIHEWTATDFASDHELARAMENVHDVIDGLDAPDLTQWFRELSQRFLRCHNVRYRLTEPYQLRPHVSGLFSALVEQVEGVVAGDAGLKALLDQFEIALTQASKTHVEHDISVCIGKAAILAEGIAGSHPDAQGNTLGAYCDSVQCWPHRALKEAFKKVYGFCSDYPGIRHAGNQRGVLRPLDSSDSIVAALVLLASAGYFVPNLDLADIVG